MYIQGRSNWTLLDSTDPIVADFLSRYPRDVPTQINAWAYLPENGTHPMNLYRRLYPSTEKQVLQHIDNQGRIHGSTVRDFFIEFAKGRFAVDDHAEKLLKELVEAGVIEILYREPIHSQAAFAGLYHSSKSYENTLWGPGTIEHYWYKKPRSKIRQATLKFQPPTPRITPMAKDPLNKLKDFTQIVHRIVGGFQKRLPKNVLREDLMAAGMSGLWDAIQRHVGDDEHFEWYARIKIRGAILDELRSQDWLPRGARWLTAEGNPISIASIVHLNDVSDAEQSKALAVEVSIEEDCSEDNRKRQLRKAITRLSGRSRVIVTLHDLKGVKLKDIAKQLNLSEARTSQLRSRAVEQLKTLMVTE